MVLADFAVFAAFAAILAVILIGGTMVAAPIRRELVAQANRLYEAPEASDALKRRIDFLLDTATSPVIAVLMIVASVATMIDGIFFSEKRHIPRFESDERYMKLVGLYFASIILANPLAFLFLLPITIFCGLVHSGAKGIRGMQLADAQIERVAHSKLIKT